MPLNPNSQALLAARWVQSTDPYNDDRPNVKPGTWWIDTAGGTGAWVAKIRNLANSGWETIAAAAGGSTHNILSATHPDTYAGDTPADNDVLLWVAAGSRWEARPAPAGANHNLFSTTHPDVDNTNTPDDNDVLTYDNASSKWRGEPPTGGGGDSTTTGLQSARPAAGNDGNVFFPTDDNFIERDNGSAWRNWGPIHHLTIPPVVASWTLVQDAAGTQATLAQQGDRVYFQAPNASEVGPLYKNRLCVKTAPSAPYNIYCAFTPLVDPYCGGVTTTISMGIILRESSTGKFIHFCFEWNNTVSESYIEVRKWTSPSVFSADYITAQRTLSGFVGRPIIFMRVHDDNTNYIFYLSNDGLNWTEVNRQSRTNFLALAANQVGLGIRPGANSAPSANGGIHALTILSWLEA